MGVVMLLDEMATLYKKLRLTDLDIFIRNRADWNIKELTQKGNVRFSQGHLYRGIGSTTWMCVRGAYELLCGRNIFLVCHVSFQGDSLMKRVLGLVQKSDPRIDWSISGGKKETRVGNNFIRYGSIGRGPSPADLVRDKGLLLDDDAWKQRAIRRYQGPFAMMREVRLEGGHYMAYAEDNEQLMELSPDALSELDSTKVTFVGFHLIHDERSSFLLPDVPIVRGIEVPAMRGALDLTGTATRGKRWRNVDFDQEYQGKWIGARSTV